MIIITGVNGLGGGRLLERDFGDAIAAHCCPSVSDVLGRADEPLQSVKPRSSCGAGRRR